MVSFGPPSSSLWGFDTISVTSPLDSFAMSMSVLTFPWFPFCSSSLRLQFSLLLTRYARWLCLCFGVWIDSNYCCDNVFSASPNSKPLGVTSTISLQGSLVKSVNGHVAYVKHNALSAGKWLSLTLPVCKWRRKSRHIGSVTQTCSWKTTTVLNSSYNCRPISLRIVHLQGYTG